MLEQENLSRNEVVKQLGITEDKLSFYAHELQIDSEPNLSSLKDFTKEDLESIRMFHKLHESGLSTNEIKLLTSYSEVLKTVEFEGSEGIKNLLSMSPVYRLKQSLNLARQELNLLRSKATELEDTLKKVIEDKAVSGAERISALEAELDLKQKAINNLESQIASYKEKNNTVHLKGKKAKQLYQLLVEKDSELTEIRKKNAELSTELAKKGEGSLELRDKLELMETGIFELEQEVEERYREQISSLREKIEILVDKKQQQWESFYTHSGEQHRKELLTLQRKHEQEILKLKQSIKEQLEELELLRMYRNPIKGILKRVIEMRG